MRKIQLARENQMCVVRIPYRVELDNITVQHYFENPEVQAAAGIFSSLACFIFRFLRRPDLHRFLRHQHETLP